MSMSRNAALFTLVVIGIVVSEVIGKPPNRIREGTDAALDEFPWIAAIGYGFKRSIPNCGGAIISARHIVTAAHCVADKEPRDLVIRTGFINIRDRDAYVRRVAEIHTHPDYQPQTEEKDLLNDIAVLVLWRDLPIDGRYVDIVSLPSKQPGNQNGTFAGWGNLVEEPAIRVPSTLQIAAVRVEDSNTCAAANNDIVLTQFICGYIKNGNTFSGDSGGPLVSNGEVIGVLSAGHGDRDGADIYVNVYYYLNWIKSIIN